jgi:SAM-dependent methyltransferase
MQRWRACRQIKADRAEMSGNFDSVYASKQIAREQNHLRRAVRSVYLRTLLKLTEGAVCDLGCGAGSFLRYAPHSSVGLDINPHAVAYCRANGLDASVYDVVEDGFSLTPLMGRNIGTLLLNHVLEHFPESMSMLRTLLLRSHSLGIRRAVIVTPGKRGFAADPTHQSYIDADFYLQPSIFDRSGFRLQSLRYFPLPFQSAGDAFVYNELRAVLVAEGGSTKTHSRPPT